MQWLCSCWCTKLSTVHPKTNKNCLKSLRVLQFLHFYWPILVVNVTHCDIWICICRYTHTYKNRYKIIHNVCHTLWHLHMCLQCILIRFTSSIILPYRVFTHLRTISIGFIVLFSYMYTKYINHIHPLHLPPLWYPAPGRTCFTFCSLFF
jgi:hypothetical protein